MKKILLLLLRRIRKSKATTDLDPQFIRERNEAFMTLDEDTIRAFFKKYNFDGALRCTSEQFMIAVHKSIAGGKDFPAEFTNNSRAWLDERGLKWCSPPMKALLLLLSLAALPAVSQQTNVVIGWQDTNNFRAAVLIGTNVVTPAITSMTYRVFASTNLLAPVKTWGVLTNVVSGNPGTNLIKCVVSAREVQQFFTVTAKDASTGLESDFSEVLGLLAIPAPVKASISPYVENP